MTERDSKSILNFNENELYEISWVADQEFETRFLKFKIADSIWRTDRSRYISGFNKNNL